jgi:3-hydroxybutyryl-CoA dehydrogenase
MGAGIAQVAAVAGLQVHLADADEDRAAVGLATVETNLARAVEKGRVPGDEAEAALRRIQLGHDPEADLAVEAVTESFEVKARLFRELDPALGEDAVLASNTSSISITRLASETERPERVIGMHFFNPVPVMGLVELVRGLETSDETFEAVRALAERMGKVPIEASDSPGFVSNRVLIPMINEAIFCVMEGVAEPEGVDEIMRLGMNHPIGPLALADLIGLDTCLSILEVLHEGFGDPKYRPCPLLRRYVAAGRLGRKSGRGFYEYANPATP